MIAFISQVMHTSKADHYSCTQKWMSLSRLPLDVPVTWVRVRSFAHFLRLSGTGCQGWGSWDGEAWLMLLQAWPIEDWETCVQRQLKQPHRKLCFPIPFVLFLRFPSCLGMVANSLLGLPLQIIISFTPTQSLPQLHFRLNPSLQRVPCPSIIVGSWQTLK